MSSYQYISQKSFIRLWTRGSSSLPANLPQRISWIKTLISVSSFLSNSPFSIVNFLLQVSKNGQISFDFFLIPILLLKQQLLQANLTCCYRTFLIRSFKSLNCSRYIFFLSESNSIQFSALMIIEVISLLFMIQQYTERIIYIYSMSVMSRGVDLIKIYRLELHDFVELFGLGQHLLLDVLFDVVVDFVFVWVLFVRLVGSIALPPALFLVGGVLVMVLFVLALDATAELPALYHIFKTKAVLLLAVRFLAGTEYQTCDSWLISVDLLKVMHVLAILLLDQLQDTILLDIRILLFLLFLHFVPFGILKKLIFQQDALRAALPNNAYLIGSEIAGAMMRIAFFTSTGAFMFDDVVGFTIEIFLFNTWLDQGRLFEYNCSFRFLCGRIDGIRKIYW